MCSQLRVADTSRWRAVEGLEEPTRRGEVDVCVPHTTIRLKRVGVVGASFDVDVNRLVEMDGAT